MFDDLQLDATAGCGLLGSFSGIALMGIGQHDVASGDLRYLLGELLHLRPVLLVGRGDMLGKQVAQRVDRGMYFDPLRRLTPW